MQPDACLLKSKFISEHTHLLVCYGALLIFILTTIPEGGLEMEAKVILWLALIWHARHCTTHYITLALRVVRRLKAFLLD